MITKNRNNINEFPNGRKKATRKRKMLETSLIHTLPQLRLRLRLNLQINPI